MMHRHKESASVDRRNVEWLESQLPGRLAGRVITEEAAYRIRAHCGALPHAENDWEP